MSVCVYADRLGAHTFERPQPADNTAAATAPTAAAPGRPTLRSGRTTSGRRRPARLQTSSRRTSEEPMAALVYTASNGWHLAPSRALTHRIGDTMSAASTSTTSEETVLRYLRRGRPMNVITSATGWDEEMITDLATEHEIRITVDEPAELDPQISEPTVTQGPVGERVPPGAPLAADAAVPVAATVVPAPAGADPAEDLIARGAASPSKRTQAASAKVKSALTALARRLDEEAAEAARAREEEAAAAALRGKITRLEKLLAATRAQLPAPRGARATTAGYDPKAVRAWAAAKGIACSPQGRVPNRVLDQWRQDQSATAA